VIQVAKYVGLSLFAVVLLAGPVMAQEPEDTDGEGAPPTVDAPAGATATQLSGALGAGLVVIGAAYGIGRLAGSALESMARQPEVAPKIQTAMIIAAALIEGFTFYALYICSTQNPWPPLG
jgi:F-type H+-transporting ATPase subunit c